MQISISVINNVKDNATFLAQVLDRTSNPVILSLYPVLGNVLLALSMLLVPMSLLGSLASPSPALVYASCLLVGGGYTVVSVACFARGHRAADGAGFSQDLAGFLMLSGERSTFGIFQDLSKAKVQTSFHVFFAQIKKKKKTFSRGGSICT